MPIFSLPSAGGIGTFGKEAYRFVDFLKKSGQSWWQILPLNPTNYGDSPYQSFSSYAGNPYFIDPQLLIEDGFLTVEEFTSFDFGDNHNTVDYGKLYENRIMMLKIAFSRFIPDDEYNAFCKDNSFWLDEYAIFMALKNAHNDMAWEFWEDELRFRDKKLLEEIKETYSSVISLYKFIQYMFSKQWFKLKEYANKNGIKIIGDIPIYVAYDSVDVWSDPKQFQLDKNLKPKAVAGCPPDIFSEDGQLWGNPLYDWSFMKKDGYSWWKKRMKYAFRLYDMVRIDHFRGFEAYWSIPYGDKTAKGGKWVKGPNMALFNEFEKEFGGDMPIIAEDLGLLTPEVVKMLKKSGFPGMKVLQFAFTAGSDSDYLPHNYGKNCVVYTGTHDNDTIIGWSKDASEDDLKMAKKYLHLDESEGINWAMMRAALMSVADICILTMQDIIGLDSSARINVPSTVGGNWVWRIDGSCINDWLANIIYDNTALYFRTQAK
jgi:4-alpha-glucanotransferase